MLEEKQSATTPTEEVSASQAASEGVASEAKKPWNKHFVQILKYICFSIGAAVIDFGSSSLLKIILPSTELCVGIATGTGIVLSCTFSMTLNRKFTFKSVTNIYLCILLYGLFYAALMPLLSLFVVWLTGMGWDFFLAKFCSMLVNFVSEFCYFKFFLFRIGNKPKAQSEKK